MIHYIGIHGPKRVGKDYFAHHLAKSVGATAVTSQDKTYTDRLAEPLYQWASAITGLSSEFLMGKDKDTPLRVDPRFPVELQGRTPRKILLDQGMSTRALYGQDFLSKCLKCRATAVHDNLFHGTDLWVFIPDVRTDDEARGCDIVFELFRDGYAYEGTATEKPLSVPVLPIVMETWQEPPVKMFIEIFDSYVQPLKLKSLPL